MKLEEINYKIQSVKSQVDQLKELKNVKDFVSESQNHIRLFFSVNSMSYQLRHSIDKADAILDKYLRLKIRIEQLIAEQQQGAGDDGPKKLKLGLKKAQYMNEINDAQNDLIATHE